MSETTDSMLAGIRDGDRRMLSRAITELENDTPLGRQLGNHLRKADRSSFTIGITGPPGAGKSTLISVLVPLLAAAGHRVAVLLVDPSSPVTGGAVLGDRVRYAQATRSEGIYVRSFGSRGHTGGLITAIELVIAAVQEAGFDLVVIETVGAGQSDIAITSIADCTICAIPPGLGDSIQAIKAGIQEVADIFVVTKGDRPGAAQTRRQMRGVPRRLGDDSPRPVFLTSATEVEGLDELVSEIHTRYHATRAPGASE